MPQPLLILGTGRLAEVLADLLAELPCFEVTGFVENWHPERCTALFEGLPVHWVEDLAPFARTHRVVCGIGSTRRVAYLEQVAAHGLLPQTVVHPHSHVSRSAVLGAGCFVSPGVVISAKAVLEDHVFVNRGATVGHHCRIGPCCTLSPGCHLAGAVRLGRQVWVGLGALIIEDRQVGDGCVVGAGATVIEDLPPRVLAVGVPAVIKRRGIEPK